MQSGIQNEPASPGVGEQGARGRLGRGTAEALCVEERVSRAEYAGRSQILGLSSPVASSRLACTQPVSPGEVGSYSEGQMAQARGD